MVSLFINATAPEFQDPGFDRAYGFNMYVVTENRTAMLDSPLPELVTRLQSSIGLGESTSLTAEVSAVVCDLVYCTTQKPEWLDNAFARNFQNGHTLIATGLTQWTVGFGL